MTDTIERSDGAEVLHRLVVRFAGDSGDGMQLTGDRFTSVSASFGNDLSTMPDFPAEIRAPAGTVNGVSSFQVHISDHEITTPGDEPNVLVAMNPAALKADLDRLEQGGTLIVNEDAFDERNLEKAEYTSNPLDDGSLATYRLIKVPMTSLTKQVCEPLGVKPRDAERSKNFFALGLVSFMYTRPIQPTIEWIAERSRRTSSSPRPTGRRSSPAITSVRRPRRSGIATRSVPPSCRPASTRASPATPPSRGVWSPPVSSPSFRSRSARTPSHRPATSSTSCRSTSTSGSARCRPRTRSRRSAWRSARRSPGHLGVTTTSGPGVSLKGETISLAVSVELPLIVVDIQRGGPSTGLPTKTEAADLNIALYGRHGEAPLPIVASYSPVHCFHAAIEAARIALKYRTPVILLSDGYLANGSEPWRLPDVDDLPDISVPFQTELNAIDRDGNAGVLAVPPRPRHARPAVGDPGHAGADAPHRRAREGRRHRQRQLHTREPRQDGGVAGRQDRPDRRRPAGARDPGRSRCRAVPAGLGIDVGRDRRRDATPPPGRAQDRVDPSHAPQPAPERSRREAAAGSATCSCPSSTAVS